MFASSEVSGESAHKCAGSSEPSLLGIVIRAASLILYWPTAHMLTVLIANARTNDKVTFEPRMLINLVSLPGINDC